MGTELEKQRRVLEGVGGGWVKLSGESFLWAENK